MMQKYAYVLFKLNLQKFAPNAKNKLQALGIKFGLLHTDDKKELLMKQNNVDDNNEMK